MRIIYLLYLFERQHYKQKGRNRAYCFTAQISIIARVEQDQNQELPFLLGLSHWFRSPGNWVIFCCFVIPIRTCLDEKLEQLAFQLAPIWYAGIPVNICSLCHNANLKKKYPHVKEHNLPASIASEERWVGAVGKGFMHILMYLSLTCMFLNVCIYLHIYIQTLKMKTFFIFGLENAVKLCNFKSMYTQWVVDWFFLFYFFHYSYFLSIFLNWQMLIFIWCRNPWIHYRNISQAN